MGQSEARTIAARRPRWRSYLLLARVSNLPTVWTNVAAGMIIGGGGFTWRGFVPFAAATSLLYVGGMVLNDAFDLDVDRAVRPNRPLPAGDVPRAEAFALAAMLLGLGEMLLAVIGLRPAIWGLALVAAVVYYDYRHKRDPMGPLVMGMCRGLVYAIPAGPAMLPTGTAIGAAIVTTYVLALTLVAKHGGRRISPAVGPLIAGISLVDAAIIGVSGAPQIAWTATLGFPLTLLLQRIVPGT